MSAAGATAERPKTAGAKRADRERDEARERAASEAGGGDGEKAGDGTENARNLEDNAGPAVGDMPPAEPETPKEPVVDEIRVEGTEQLSIFDVGGKRANTATIKLTGGKVKIVDGQGFKKGTRVRGTFEAIVNEVGQKDEEDPKTGQVVSAEQRHSARIVDLQVESASA